jgi:dual specificity tyrosine-phosphorylation-regulated kinase 2/3/4
MAFDKDMLELLGQYEGRPWAIDVWSIGCVILEVLTGLPLWMSLKTVVHNYARGGVEELRCGLFAVRDRSFSAIIAKQLKVVTNLSFYLANCNYSGITPPTWLTTLLKSIFSIQPKDRPSPTKIVECFAKHCVEI